MYIFVGLFDRGMVGEPFTFRLPSTMHMPAYGDMVRVPVGKTEHIGVVLGFSERTDLAEDAILDIIQIEEKPMFSLAEWQCSLILWMSAWYCSPLHKVLRLFIPAPLWNKSFQPKEDICVKALVAVEDVPARQKQVRAMIEFTLSDEVIMLTDVREHFSRATYKKALMEGYIEERALRLTPVETWKPSLEMPKTLTQEQKVLLEDLLRHRETPGVLYGVTGAGKTEVYLHLALQMKEEGKQTLLLVPEIALTPQLVGYFQRVFGEGVAVVHSHRSEGEKSQEWLRVARHEVDVLIGSRSALFAPFAALGQVIVDEEHEWTYKNEQNPRYLVHRVAETMAEQARKTGRVLGVLFASGTPSIERFARAKQDVEGKDPLRLYTLDKKIFEQTR